jgi:hypothetical protein
MRRTLVALTLSTALVTTAPAGFLDRVWMLFSHLWERSGPVHQPQSKEGCHGDPNGQCVPGTQPETDADCEMDPNGLCKPGS